MSFQNLNDEELMSLYQTGSDTAFYALYERHSAKIYAYLKRRVSDKSQMEDIYQDVFVKVHKSKHLYNPALPVLPWLFTITKSVLIDALRKDKSSKYVDDFNFDLLSYEPQLQTAGASEIQGLINQLPETQKAALEMRYIDEKTFEEIARKLKTSPMNARKIISRGIARMKQFMEIKD